MFLIPQTLLEYDHKDDVDIVEERRSRLAEICTRSWMDDRIYMW